MTCAAIYARMVGVPTHPQPPKNLAFTVRGAAYTLKKISYSDMVALCDRPEMDALCGFPCYWCPLLPGYIALWPRPDRSIKLEEVK